MHRLTKKKWIIICVITAALAAAITLTAFASLYRSPEDTARAEDLSALSGLPRSLIFDLYDLQGSWDPLTRDAFLYRRMYTLKNAWGLNDTWLVEASARWDTLSLLAALDFGQREGYDKDRLLELFSLAEESGSLDDLVSAAALNDTQTYQNYCPATETEVLAWLSNGYTSEQILTADEAARALDVTLPKALREGLLAPEKPQLNGKFGIIGSKLDALKSEASPTVIIQNEDGSLSTYTAADWEKLEDKIQSDIVPEKSISAADGLDVSRWPTLGQYDFDNAAKLADETGADPAVILDTRASGMDWKDILALFRAAGSVSEE